jgi:hypothetical protein
LGHGFTPLLGLGPGRWLHTDLGRLVVDINDFLMCIIKTLRKEKFFHTVFYDKDSGWHRQESRHGWNWRTWRGELASNAKVIARILLTSQS